MPTTSHHESIPTSPQLHIDSRTSHQMLNEFSSVNQAQSSYVQNHTGTDTHDRLGTFEPWLQSNSLSNDVGSALLLTDGKGSTISMHMLTSLSRGLLIHLVWSRLPFIVWNNSGLIHHEGVPSYQNSCLYVKRFNCKSAELQTHTPDRFYFLNRCCGR